MPSVLESPKPSPPVQDRQSTFVHRAVRTALRAMVVALLAATLVGSWYLARKGFGRQWRYRVVEELHKRGVEASIRRLTLDPFRGLVAQDVRIFSYKHRGTPLAVISEIALDVNYAALIHRQPFLNALDVGNAQITLPLKSSDGKSDQPQLKNFRAHVYFPPEQIYVSQAEGLFCGVRISATGQLIKRENYQPSPKLSQEEWQRRMSILRRVVSELQKFTFPAGPPSLQVKFSGDLAQIEDARVEATLRGDRLQRKNYEIRDLVAAAEWSDQKLDLTQCEWKDNAGSFAGRASWSRQSNEANFQARSSLDVKTLLEAAEASDSLVGATFNSPPVIELSGSGNFGGEHPKLKVIGHAAVRSFTYKAVPLSDLRAEFSWDGERTWLRDLHVRHETGELHADLLDAPNDFRLNIDSTINPGALRPFVSPEMQEFLGEWEWPRPPVVHLAIRAQDRHPENWRGEGSVALERARFRSAWMNSASAKIRFGDGAVTYDDLRVTRDEGVGTGSFTYDFAKHEVRVSNVKTSLRPADVIFWIDPDLWKTVVLYKFHQTPNITANGVYQFRGGTKTRLEITVDAPGGMDYVFLGKTLPVDRISSRLLFTKDLLQIVDLRGSLFSGTVHGKSDISLAHNAPHHHASITVSNVNFPRLTDLYFNYKTASGELSGTYDFDGLGGDARKMSGNGKLEVTNGDVFAIPVFGPLSGILSHILPGTAGYSIAHEATASFTIKDGVIHTDDFDVAGKLFDMLGRGDIYFLDDKLDFDIRISAKGAGIVLAPVYKLFEYKGEGTLKNPDWHPKRF
jgi:AsmA-like C-terminal region